MVSGSCGKDHLSPTLTWRRFQMPSRKGVLNRLFRTDAHQCNKLIQCPVPVPICCMFFDSQNIHTKRSPNRIKADDFFWNIYDFWEFESPQTEAHTAHKAPGHARGPGAWWWVVPSSNVGWSSTSGARKIIFGKNHVKISVQLELWISGYKRNREGPDPESAKQKRTEREIQSRRGSCPSAIMEATDQRGNPPPI